MQKKTDEYETPPEVFAKLHKEFRFTTDLCALKTTAKVPNYWGADRKDDQIDGLKMVPGIRTVPGGGEEWGIWCNPPYSQGNLARWVNRCCDIVRPHYGILSTKQCIVLLLPMSMSTKWARRLWGDSWCHEIRFCDRRISFLLDGVRRKAPAAENMIAVLRSEKRENRRRPQVGYWEVPPQ